MSNPTAVFLKCGSISFAAGLAIWLLLLQLHDKTGKSKPQLDPANPGSEHADILKELEIAVALPKPARPGSDDLKPFAPDTPPPLVQRKTTPPSASPFGPENNDGAEPLEASTLPPKPVIRPPQPETHPLPAPLDMRAEPREEHVMPASAEMRNDLLETRIAQGSVETRIAFAPVPPPAEARLRPQEPQPKSYKPAGLSPPTLLPTPPLPERRPQRIAASDEPRSIQAITQRQSPRKPGLTWNGALSFLANLWRSPEPMGRPTPHTRACDDAAGAAPTTPCSRVGTRFLRQ